MKSGFSIEWIKSVQPRKQRKYRFNAPAHIRSKFMNVSLAKDLRKKHETRAVRVRKGDKVKALRGSFKGQSGTVEKVSPVREQVFVTGIEIVKKDGGKVPYPLHPSNLQLISLAEDKRRFKKQKTEEK
ncbi:50S ribosomal protein L24 [Candidatus Woesearchaeota archaeon]|nr:50S ribosomal protein L24 [Candidatus Woesearchaeota archaeon]